MVKTSVAASPAGPDALPDSLAGACPVMDSLVQDAPGMDSPGAGGPDDPSPGTSGPGTSGPGTSGPGTGGPPADRHAPAATSTTTSSSSSSSSTTTSAAGTATRPARSLWPARALRMARLTGLGWSGRSARPVDMDAAA